MFDLIFFFFKQKTAYEMRISDWSSDVCSSDLHHPAWDLLPDLVDADHVGGALLDQAVAVMRDQIAMVLPTLLDGERADGKICNVPPRTPASAELPIQTHPLARGQDIGVEIGRSHVRTPVTHANLGCRLLLANNYNT